MLSILSTLSYRYYGPEICLARLIIATIEPEKGIALCAIYLPSAQNI